jgi:outer membrane protein assembly factor BamA
VVEEYGDTEQLSLSDLLFLGGGRTIRGFDYRDVGPKAVRYAPDGSVVRVRPIGGRTLAMASAEYTIPVIEGIRFALFYDIGNVWREAYDFDFGRMASGTGLGLRFDLPGFPIRIDRAWALEKDHELSDEDDWVVWIGFDY